MARAQYGRGNIVCPACGKKTATDGHSMTFAIGAVEADIVVTRCFKCSTEFVDDTKIVRGRRGDPVTPEMWANRLAALERHQAREQHFADCHLARVREAIAARDALLASGLLPPEKLG